jgi:hypothetical protein
MKTPQRQGKGCKSKKAFEIYKKKNSQLDDFLNGSHFGRPLVRLDHISEENSIERC